MILTAWVAKILLAFLPELRNEDAAGHTSFTVRGLLDNDYKELAVTSAHAVFLESLPLIHKDPFDRILVAQATVEGITLLTADSVVARYPGPIQLV